MPLPPYGETKDVPGTPAWRALHPVGDWFKNAKYNAAYDPMHFGDSNHGIPYQSPSTSYQQPSGWDGGYESFSTETGEMRHSTIPNQITQSGQIDNAIPQWQPPAQAPQQDQGQLFQNNNQGGESAIPTWQPPAQGPQMGTLQNTSMGTAQRRYQSPSTNYLRNQRTF